MALFGMTFIVQAVKVPTGSMQNTITIGDHLLVNKFIFAPGPIFRFCLNERLCVETSLSLSIPGINTTRRRDERPDNKPIVTNYVKRVIGLPGDRLSMEGRTVMINGQPLPEHQMEAIDNNDKAPLRLKMPRRAHQASSTTSTTILISPKKTIRSSNTKVTARKL